MERAPEEQNGRTQEQIVDVEVISRIDDGRPGEHLHAALPVRWERLPAGALQRELAFDAGIRSSGARSARLRAVVSAVRPSRALWQLSRHGTRCGVVFLLSRDLSQVHRKGDLGDEVDGMKRKRRRRLKRVPEDFERCRCAHDVHFFSWVQRFSFHDLPLVVVFLLCFFMWELAGVGTG